MGFLPHLFQRVFLAKNAVQTRKAFFSAGLLWLIMAMFITCLSTLLLMTKPKLVTKNLLFDIIKEYTDTEGLRGLVAIGICSIIMSTADSYINTTAVLVVNDVLQLKPTHPYSLLILRGVSLLVSAIAISMTLIEYKLEDFSFFMFSFYMPIVIMPLLIGLMGFRTTERVAIGSILFSVLISAGTMPFFSDPVRTLIGIVANLCTTYAGHYLLGEPGGWVGVKVKAPLVAERQAGARRWQNVKNKIAHFELPTYLKNQFPATESTYFLLSLYVMGPVFLAYFALQTVLNSAPRFFWWTSLPMLASNALVATYPMESGNPSLSGQEQ